MTRKHVKSPIDIQIGRWVRGKRVEHAQGQSLNDFLQSRLALFDDDGQFTISIDTWRNIESGSTAMTLETLWKVALILDEAPVDIFDLFIDLREGGIDSTPDDNTL
ncbi:hypothetical protein [Schleiferilactobacillus shenzhenensis]|uniref:hypothetical protein n=1 Tax=Schleiferilactobacillus shenzhenensis TaxID=1231337 RepID=UPI00058D1B6C|nr:hypothetical protein [Schleiferilactobacillus shenzhenensis]